MRLSRYFLELSSEYEAELDDLRTDSEGKRVLDARLKEKGRNLAALLPMLIEAPLMLVPAFHRAFGFERNPGLQLTALLKSEPGDFPSWGALSSELDVAGWAQPLIDLMLAEDGGEDFLGTAVGLEFALSLSDAGAEGSDDSSHDGERDGDGDADPDTDSDLETDENGDRIDSGEDFLEQQGFDRRTPQ